MTNILTQQSHYQVIYLINKLISSLTCLSPIFSLINYTIICFDLSIFSLITLPFLIVTAFKKYFVMLVNQYILVQLI